MMRSLCGYLLLVAITAYTLGSMVGSFSVLGLGGTSTFSVAPTIINRHQTVNVVINETGDILPPNTYTYIITVTLPDSSTVSKTVSLVTNPSNGQGAVVAIFPNDFSGAATQLDGNYQVQVTQTVPSNVNLGTKNFSVTKAISLVILNPQSGASFTRGNSTSIISQAKDVQGKPFTGLSVNFTTPTNSTLPLSDPLSTGVYSGLYTLKYSDPTQWRIIVNATDAWGNFGSQSVNVVVQAAVLRLDPIYITDSTGKHLASTTLNQTIYVLFNARYPDGTFVTTGSANVTIIAPNGAVMARLTATYSAAMGGFFSRSGYFIQPSQQSGRWSAVIYTGQVSDGSGNVGPFTPATTQLTVGSMPFTFTASFLTPFLLVGLGAIGSMVVLSRKSRTGFEYFDKITGGGIPDGSLVMLYGESKSGKSLLLEEMLYKRLREKKPCIYITYELTSDEILRNAGDFKWDLEPFVENGLLTLIDNSDLMSSLDLSKTRMKLSSALTLKENTGLQLFIDSMDLLFEDLDYREVKLFLTKLTEEVRKLHGSVYFSLTTSNIIKQTIPEIQDIIDWTIELQTRKKGSKLERIMVIQKMKDPNYKGTNSRFRLVKKKGMVFDVPLIRKLGKS